MPLWWHSTGANLTAHALAPVAIDALVPDKKCPWNLALDYEGWQPVWDDLLGATQEHERAARERNASQLPAAISLKRPKPSLMRQQEHSTMSRSRRCERCARMKWSHHAFPVTVCYDQPLMREHNDKMRWLYSSGRAFAFHLSATFD